VAIDGPAGAGKSTVARALAARLGLRYLDTGAMYRGVTHAVLRRGVDPADGAAVARVARETLLVIDDDTLEVDGEDATAAIRGPAVTAAVSFVAANSEVRTLLRGRQRDLVTRRGGGVVEGRDIGSVVFPDAILKVYLTASPEVRARRRVAEAGGDAAEIAEAIRRRDALDSSRADSPLRLMPDAWVVDTSDTGVAEVVARIAAEFALRRGRA
jgi:cytidylate kinase